MNYKPKKSSHKQLARYLNMSVSSISNLKHNKLTLMLYGLETINRYKKTIAKERKDKNYKGIKCKRK